MSSAVNHVEMSMSMDEEKECMLAIQFATSSALTMALKVAIELNVLEIVANKGTGAHLSPSEIVSQLPARNPNAASMLECILRLLASYSILTCKTSTRADGPTERLYGLAPVCKFLIKNRDGASFAPLMLECQDKAVMDTWFHLKDAILEGGVPFYKVHGMTSYEYTSANAAFGDLFANAMSDHSKIITKKIVEIYKGFEGVQQLVDVGGGTGSSLNIIVSKYPQIKGICFDLPHVIANALHYSGIEYIGGDMLVSVPSAETILIKWVLLHWSDDECLQLLKNCYKALPEQGKLIMVENLLPDMIENNVAARSYLQFDVIETVWGQGGCLRAEKEFEALAKQAGFSGLSVICGACGFWVMECYKKNEI